MDITYDPRYNIAYIRLRRKTAGVKTLQVSEELNIDLAPNGKGYGIELLNAREQLIKERRSLSWTNPQANPESCRWFFNGRVSSRPYGL